MLYSLQGLRAIAALLVVYYHSHGLLVKRASELNLAGPFWFEESEITKWGAVGVDVFFVLSGFIIFYITWDKKYTVSKFLLHRINRIYPIWWAALTCMVIISLLPGSSANFTVSQIIQSYLLIPASYEETQVKPVLPIGWTLYYEMTFYLVAGSLITLPPMLRLQLVTALFVVLSFIGVAVDFDTPVLQVVTNYRTLEFVMGGWIACLFITRPAVVHTNLLSGIALVTAVVSPLLFIFYDELAGAAVVLVRASFAAALFVLCLWCTPVINFTRHRAMVWIGNASYSIYLFHSFPLLVLSGLWKRQLLIPPEWMPAPAIWIGVFGISSLAGVIAYHLLEKPLLNLTKNLFFKRFYHGSQLNKAYASE